MSDEQISSGPEHEREIDIDEATRLLDEIESELEAIGHAIARITDPESATARRRDESGGELDDGD